MESFIAIAALQSLAQETRLEVFRLLVKAGPEGLTAGEIAAALSVPPPTLSFHLNHLRHATLIACRREGRSLWYSVSFEQIRALLGFLMEDCCQGRAEVLSPAKTSSCCTLDAAGEAQDACCS